MKNILPISPAVKYLHGHLIDHSHPATVYMHIFSIKYTGNC